MLLSSWTRGSFFLKDGAINEHAHRLMGGSASKPSRNRAALKCQTSPSVTARVIQSNCTHAQSTTNCVSACSSVAILNSNWTTSFRNVFRLPPQPELVINYTISKGVGYISEAYWKVNRLYQSITITRAYVAEANQKHCHCNQLDASIRSGEQMRFESRF